ncbi:proline dehydrogenase family protein [Acidiluteibacter ferrifornacis]|uniref:Proline dehydrogenase n=1 Tax=Acidiluteibacter ferrifornacis TaxID=2692424 RepID=A0A6N9NKW8_9FLAO|nr:proline dehydrogenase family protein [Acidiluteibacter ferrifornacis]NBG66512.1 proline dehydrogenase [Acidiluteibacter ferrifornacis]
MVTFNNTKIAFENKNNTQLRKAYWLFKFMGINWLTKIGAVLLKIALFLRLPVKGLVKITVFEHFCGGESIEECETRIQELANFNVKTILDYSAEGKETDEDFDLSMGKAVASIERAKKDTNVPFCVFKVTALMPFDVLKKVSAKEELSEQETLDYQKGRNRIDIICQNAANAGIPLMIDAEESWIQDAIDEIALIMMHRYNRDSAVVYNTAQMYRHDRLEYLKELYRQSVIEGFYIGMKVVRGAYMEKERERAARKGYPSPIQPDKAATDTDYNLAITFCVEHLDKFAICCGTHNEASSQLLTELIEAKGLHRDDKRLFFSQLLGMSDHISFNLSKKDYNVSKYVPYGPVAEVMPYLIRRADENTSIAGQTGRELRLIQEELDRRTREAS